MVISAIFEQLIPSERGLTRDESIMVHGGGGGGGGSRSGGGGGPNDEGGVWKYQLMTDNNNNTSNNPTTTISSSSGGGGALATSTQPSPPVPKNEGVTRTRRKRCRASKFLASLASDLDIITDWIFYFHCARETSIPSLLLHTILVVCIAGSMLWLTLATDGRIAAPLLRYLGYDKLSLGYLLFLSVIIEDIPQVILTFIVEDYFQEDSTFNNYALMNVVASLYDTLIKLAEAFDDRRDIVETGMYCKESLWAHRGNITCIIPLLSTMTTLEDEDGNSTCNTTDNRQRQQSHNGTTKSSSPLGSSVHVSLAVAKMRPVGGFDNRVNSSQVLHVDNDNTRTPPRIDFVGETKLPRLTFLSASEDETIRLWDTHANRIGHIRNKCVVAYRGHTASVTCMTLLVSMSLKDRRIIASYSNVNSDVSSNRQQYDKGTMFLTGSSDGTVRLWNTQCSNGRCYRVYETIIADDSRSTSESRAIMTIAHLGVDISSTSQRSFTSSLTASTSTNIVVDDGQHDDNNRFVCGYTSGKIRMFNMISGVCIATFNEHVGTVFSICNLNISEGGGFASGGEDGMIKVWRSNHSNYSGSNNSHNGTQQSIDLFKSCSNVTDTIPSLSRSASSNADNSTTVPPIIRKSIQTIVGHTGAILAMAYVSSQIILTGGVDCTARVWNIEKEVCLRIFIGHAASVTTVAAVDHVTFLTGSKDKSIKVWDGLSASCIRTYTGHTSPVTCVRSAQPGTFISASEDRTIKLWVYTAVSSNMNSDNGGDGTLNDILGFDDTFACMDCGKRNDTTDDNGTMIV